MGAPAPTCRGRTEAAGDAAFELDTRLAQELRAHLQRAAEGPGDRADRAAAWGQAACAWDHLLAGPTLAGGRTDQLQGELTEEVAEAFAAGRRALASDPSGAPNTWERAILPGRQIIEKSLFLAAHRVFFQALAAAEAGSPGPAPGPAPETATAIRRAVAAFSLLRDRLRDKNTPAIAVTDRLLADALAHVAAGKTPAIDREPLTRALAIAFAKRARKYTDEVLRDPTLRGAAGGLASVAEGMTYSRLLLPDMSTRLGSAGFDGEAYLATWAALREEVELGDDPGELRRLSDELVHWNCAYQAALGIAECTYHADETQAPRDLGPALAPGPIHSSG